MMSQHVSVTTDLLEMEVTKQLIVSTSTSALMELMLASIMNCVLILLDRTNAISYRVSFISSAKNAKSHTEQTAFRISQ